MEKTEQVKKKKSFKLKKLIILFILLMIAVTATLAYFKNDTFKSKIDVLLNKLTWNKSKNSSSLTDEGQVEKIRDLAEYYLSLDQKNAAEKLYVIKSDDEVLYSEIVKFMNEKSSSKTSEIIKLVRKMGDRKDLLAYIHNEINEEKDSEQKKEIQRLENQDLLVTIREVESRIKSDKKFSSNMSGIFANMNEETLANILYYVDEEVKEQIMGLLEDDKISSLESKILNKKNEELRLVDLANIYETKPLETCVKEIGNSETYSFEELGVIYSNLSILKSSQILSKVKDDNFIQELFSYIRRESELKGKESPTTKINKSIEFITEYNEKIDELVKVYEEMSPDKVAKIVEKMINNNNTVTSLEIDSEPIFKITDASIIKDVLSRMSDKTLSNVINNMTTENASKLTQMLAKP